ncbi:MAG: tail fiber domain-containing protein, partial [Chitinophagales bacterium]|nr:tail fiber domain-containing protein [Chitinophagales bacterium]
TKYMTIKGTAYANPGWVGINAALPAGRLEVAEPGANADILRLTNSTTGGFVSYRVTTAGNGIIRPSSGSFLGIGDFTQNKPPQEKLDVFAPTNRQLRLTQTQLDINIPNSGRWANFRVDLNGDLVITPWQNDGTVARYTGIGNGTCPTATLHVFGNAKIDNVPSGSASNNFVVWDGATHELQYRTLPVGTGTVINCALPSLNFLTKWTNLSTNEICNSQVNDDGVIVKIVHSPPATLGFVNIKNDLLGSSYTAALQVENTNNSMGNALALAGKFRAMYATADGQYSGEEKGIEVYALGGTSANTNNTGTYSQAKNATTNNIGVAGYGYSFQGQNTAVNNIGVYGKANGASAFNTGIYGDLGTNGVGNWAGYFLGPVSASSYTINPSDAVFKTNIKSIEGGLDKILALKPSTYEYDTEKFSYKHFFSGTTPGFIADDVVQIIPEIVKKCNDPVLFDSLGAQINDVLTYNGLQIDGLIPYIVAAIQELNSKVDDCCNSGMHLQEQGSNPSQSIKIISESIALLGDCVPNPTDGNTIITVKVPEKIGEAIIIFTDQLGKEVFREVITNRGYSDLNIETSQLENGIYHYSLVVEGKLIATKQLVKQH